MDGKIQCLTLSSLQTNTWSFVHVNSVDHDEIKPGHQDLQFTITLLIWDWNPYLQKWVCPNSEKEKFM